MKFHSKCIDKETLRTHLKKVGAHSITVQKRYKEADEEKQIEFAWNFLHVAVNYGFTKILFVDEMSVFASEHSGYGWTFNQGSIVDVPQRNKIKTNISKQRGFGRKSNRNRKEKHKSGLFISFLKKVEATYSDNKIPMCMDNGKIYHA
jgi:hypothetical protein